MSFMQGQRASVTEADVNALEKTMADTKGLDMEQKQGRYTAMLKEISASTDESMKLATHSTTLQERMSKKMNYMAVGVVLIALLLAGTFALTLHANELSKEMHVQTGALTDTEGKAVLVGSSDMTIGPNGYDHWEEPVYLYNDGQLLTVTFHDKVGGIGLGPAFTLLDESWVLQQLTIHAPSEHVWGDSHLPAELQLVHAPSSGSGELAVVVIGLSRGLARTPDAFLDSLLAEGVPEAGESRRTNLHAPQALEFGTLFSDIALEYEGSGTIPPCTPNMRYFVREEPYPTNPEKLDELLRVVALSTGVPDGNYRIPQPLHNRTVLKVRTNDATGMETAEELLHRAMRQSSVPPTAPPTVPLESRDPDNEDAFRETTDVRMQAWFHDPTKEALAKEAGAASSAAGMLKAFNESTLQDAPETIVSGLGTVRAAEAELAASSSALTAAQQELDALNAKLILVKQARDYAEGRTNLTGAEGALLTAQKDAAEQQKAVDSVSKRAQLAREALDTARSNGHNQVVTAQRQLAAMKNASAHGADMSAPLMPNQTATAYALPTGSFADPFSRHSAELRSRITARPMPRYLSPLLAPNGRRIANTVALAPPLAAEGAAQDGVPTGLHDTDVEPSVVEA